jgi:hypothetical protein
MEISLPTTNGFWLMTTGASSWNAAGAASTAARNTTLKVHLDNRRSKKANYKGKETANFLGVEINILNLFIATHERC